MAAAALLVLVSWICPPWIFGSRTSYHHGWFSIVDTTHGAMRIDFGRLFLLDGIILAAGGLFAYACNQKPRARAVVALAVLTTVCLLCVASITYVSLPALQSVQHATAEAKRGNRLRNLLGAMADIPSAHEVFTAVKRAKGDGNSDEAIYVGLTTRFKGFLPVHELRGSGYKMASNDGFTLTSLLEAIGRDATKLEAEQLKKISVFDVQFETIINKFKGRIRNDLESPVKNVVLRGSFYSPQGQLIEVRPFPLSNEIYEPGIPVSFSSAGAPVGSLPAGCTYTIKVADAYYDQLPPLLLPKWSEVETNDQFKALSLKDKAYVIHRYAENMWAYQISLGSDPNKARTETDKFSQAANAKWQAREAAGEFLERAFGTPTPPGR